jgi:hypothetical protein
MIQPLGQWILWETLAQCINLWNSGELAVAMDPKGDAGMLNKYLRFTPPGAAAPQPLPFHVIAIESDLPFKDLAYIIPKEVGMG